MLPQRMWGQGKSFCVSQAPPLLLHHNLCRGKLDTFLFASSRSLVSFDTASGKLHSFCSLGEDDASSLQVINGSETAALVTTASAAYIVKEGGGIISFAVNSTSTAACCASMCFESPSTPQAVRVAIGTTSGLVGFFNCSLTDVGKTIMAAQTAQQHHHQVTALATESSNSLIAAVSGDSAGTVIVWNRNGCPLAEMKDELQDSVSDVLVMSQGMRVAASYGSGKISIFSPSGQREVEIRAHSKWITAMSYHSERNLLASAGEDGVVNVWMASSNPDLVLTHHSSRTVSTGLPTGLAFHTSGTYLMVASYGSPFLQRCDLK